MVTSAEYVDWIIDQLCEFGEVETKRLFGGRAVLKNGQNFGLIFEDQLYLKADAQSLPKFKEVGSEQFTYEKGGKTILVSFWTVSETVIEDLQEFAIWAEAALDAALRAKKPKSKR